MAIPCVLVTRMFFGAVDCRRTSIMLMLCCYISLAAMASAVLASTSGVLRLEPLSRHFIILAMFLFLVSLTSSLSFCCSSLARSKTAAFCRGGVEASLICGLRIRRKVSCASHGTCRSSYYPQNLTSSIRPHSRSPTLQTLRLPPHMGNQLHCKFPCLPYGRLDKKLASVIFQL